VKRQCLIGDISETTKTAAAFNLVGMLGRDSSKSGISIRPEGVSVVHHDSNHLARGSRQSGSTGLLIVNADDWGLNYDTTQRTLECILKGAVSSVSAMVYMNDSERGAAIAREKGVDAGLHLNLTTPFSAPGAPARLVEHHKRLSRYLRTHRFAQAVFHPGLVESFKYVVGTQRDEFYRLYGAEPSRVDGHHHMHLSSNVLLGRLIPVGTVVRRSFSFHKGEKSLLNRLFRDVVDRQLARHYLLTDYFFSLPPLTPRSRLQKIFSLASQFTVELETHPVRPEEYRFLMGGEIFRWARDLSIAARYVNAPASAGVTQSGRVQPFQG
jgi:hypothetical protein